jgi:DNA polymerase-3 subunit delta
MAYVKQPNPSSVVLLVCQTKPNLSANPYRALKTHAEAAHFGALYDRQMPGWIQAYVQDLNCRIDPDAVQMLASLNGTDLRTTALEIDKLTAYIGDRNRITCDDVLDVGGHSRTYNVFQLQRHVGARQFNKAMDVMERMLQGSANRRSEALMIVSVLTAYFIKLRKLTVCQARRMNEKAMATRIGVPVFFIKEYLSSLRWYPMAAIEQAFAVLLAADYELKGGANRNEGLILALAFRRLM